MVESENKCVGYVWKNAFQRYPLNDTFVDTTTLLGFLTWRFETSNKSHDWGGVDICLSENTS